MALESHAHQNDRLLPLDLLRGLLMILMALDHANFLIAQQHSSGEYWGGQIPYYSSPLHFLVRFVTHFSAPGFFFILGVGMMLFASSRRKKGWRESDIRRHFLLRGLVLIFLQLFLNYSQAWSVAGSSALLWYVGVLAALGVGMIICIPLLGLRSIFLVGMSLGFFIVMEVLTPDPALWGQNFDDLVGTLLIYSGGSGEYWTNYPFLAWIELIILGLLYGKWILKDPRKAYQNGAWLGAVFLIGFAVLRKINGFGNIRSIPISDWTSFLSLVKYPPSMTFVLITTGINLIMLWVFSRIRKPIFGEGDPFLIFGRVPLFFYLAHIMVYFLLGRALAPNGSSMGVMILLWAVGLGILYYPARWYSKFKASQPSRSWVKYL